MGPTDRHTHAKNPTKPGHPHTKTGGGDGTGESPSLSISEFRRGRGGKGREDFRGAGSSKEGGVGDADLRGEFGSWHSSYFMMDKGNFLGNETDGNGDGGSALAPAPDNKLYAWLRGEIGGMGQGPRLNWPQSPSLQIHGGTGGAGGESGNRGGEGGTGESPPVNFHVERGGVGGGNDEQLRKLFGASTDDNGGEGGPVDSHDFRVQRSSSKAETPDTGLGFGIFQARMTEEGRESIEEEAHSETGSPDSVDPPGYQISVSNVSIEGSENTGDILGTPLSSDPDAVSPSTIVILAPGPLPNDPTAVRPNDVSFLENAAPNGGNSCDICRSVEAETWVEEHFDAPLLKSIRSAGLGGPLATMLSPETPALAIFGSFLDDRVLDLAQALCEQSAFAVMIRPENEDPVAMFLRQSLIADETSEIKQHIDPAETPDDKQQSDDQESDTESTAGTRSESDDDLEVPPRDGAFRLRGGASHGEGNFGHITPAQGVEKPVDGAHGTKLTLHLHATESGPYDVVLSTETMFKFQTLKADKREFDDPLTRPQILSSVDLKIEMRPSELLLDDSYSNLGFIVHKPNSIFDREYLPRGFERPATIATNTTQDSTQGGGSLSGGTSGVAVTVSGGQTTGKARQLADQKPAPLCVVNPQVGKEWNIPTSSYSSYDLGWHTTKDEDGIQHPLKIRFGMGIKLDGEEERNLIKLPQISHVLRSQVILWINNPTLQARARGVIVLTTTYLPEIRNPKRIRIPDEKHIDLVHTQPHDPQPLNSIPFPHNAANSVAVGLIDRKTHLSPKKTHPTPKTGFRKIPRNLVKIFRRQKFMKSGLIDIPLHEYVARGWDETNKEWRNTVWPSLDEDFQSVPAASAAVELTVTPGAGVGSGAEPQAAENVVGPSLGTTRPAPGNLQSDSSVSTTSLSSAEGIRVALPEDSGTDNSEIGPSGYSLDIRNKLQHAGYALEEFKRSGE
ncbi:hypothetical protein FB45DRAFT_927433 [Roridomyces roridus]|uniref:Uncharacterized protein n=1 Tax=Roridomyces roridus TaxID=1738132 RepID=A0AAD7BIZ3_9AGAR|nr:hypothetical protein FB45DRAFT_927433 [Roridomyces roridus]